MFVYSINNPLKYYDPDGMWTISIMVSGNGTAGIGIYVANGVAIDGKGNIEEQYSYTIPGVDETIMVGLLDAGVCLSLMVTNADTVYDLHGLGTSIGGSLGYSEYLSVDLVSLGDFVGTMDSNEDAPWGAQVGIGLGVGVDFHINQSYTAPVHPSPTEIYTYEQAASATLDFLLYVYNTFEPFMG